MTKITAVFFSSPHVKLMKISFPTVQYTFKKALPNFCFKKVVEHIPNVFAIINVLF